MLNQKPPTRGLTNRCESRPLTHPSPTRERGTAASALLFACLLVSLSTAADPADAQQPNFTSGDQTAVRFGVHEIELHAQTVPAQPLDTIVTVRFVPPSGQAGAVTVWAFYDGGNTWRARVYVNEPGVWHWKSQLPSSDAPALRGLHGQSGQFHAVDSALPGRLLPHPDNPRQWITENGQWFLNLSDTAYFLLCPQDGNGQPVTDETALQYVEDDVQRGITSLRCFVASHPDGFRQTNEQWEQWYFGDDPTDRDTLRLDTLQHADRRLRLLLDRYPSVAIQLILCPLTGYNRDETFWPTLTEPQRERLMRQWVARFAAYPQLFWLVVNDAHYGDRFPQHANMARQVGRFLQQHDRWQHPRSTGPARRVPFPFAAEDWVDYVHLEDEHDLGARRYAEYHAAGKPVFMGEDRYEQDRGPATDPVDARYWQRRLYWSWLLAGGSTNYGGRWWTVQPYSQTGQVPAQYTKRSDHTHTAPLVGLDSVRAIRDFFGDRQIDLGPFSPAAQRILVADDWPAARRPLALQRTEAEPGRTEAEPGRAAAELLVYHPHAAEDGRQARPADGPAVVHLDLTDLPGNWSVQWYRCEDGLAASGDLIAGGQTQQLTAPWSGHDVVLWLTASPTTGQPNP